MTLLVLRRKHHRAVYPQQLKVGIDEPRTNLTARGESRRKSWLGIDRIDPAYYTVAHGDGHSTQATASA